MKITTRRVSDLIPYARNSRTHNDAQIAQIAASIKEFGFTNPILTDGDNGLIAGHGRLLAAQKLGLVEVPTISLEHLSQTQRRAYVIADNRLALNAGWDMEMLSIELSDLDAAEFDMDLIGFDHGEIDQILESAKSIRSEGLTDPDATPDVHDESISKLGDVWILGNHRVMCGDSTDVTAMDKLMGGALADMLLTDPPYNVAYEGKTKDALRIKNDSMNNDEFRQFLRDAFATANTSMKPGAVFYIWHADSEGYNFRGACVDIGWRVRQCLIWKKQTMVMGRQDYHWKHEPCLYGWKDGSGHLWASDRKQTTILEFDRPNRNAEHPTMKPVALFEYLILNNTKGSDIILDLFGGSGTTVIASEMNGRFARIMEIDTKYVDVIIRRWQEYTGKSAILECDGKTFTDIEVENASRKTA